VNLDALARATADLDEGTFVAKFAQPALLFKPPTGDTHPGPDLETDRYALPGQQLAKARESMGSSIVLFLKSNKGEPFISVGRGREADLAIPLGNVSRVHALFSQHSHGAWSVTDNRSTNGTFVNDAKVQPGATLELPEGAWVRFGADATVKFFTPLGLFGYLRNYRSSIGAG
jgi:hypothetical protein